MAKKKFSEVDIGERFTLHGISFIKIGNNENINIPTRYQMPNCINEENKHRCVVSARSIVEV